MQGRFHFLASVRKALHAFLFDRRSIFLSPVSAVKKLIFAYIVLCAIMFAAQRFLMYKPLHDVQPPASYGLTGFSEIQLSASDGVTLQAWYKKAATGYPTIVFFHGNGGHLGYRAHYFALLAKQGFGLLAPEYRGYGNSGGSPSEAGLYLDAQAAVDYSLNRLSLPRQELILYGESLGTGVAVQMASERDYGGLILQSPYTSLEDIAKDLYFWLPVHFLIRDRFDSIGKMDRVHTPLLVIHGEQDTVVPVHYGKEIFAKANSPKESVWFPVKGHNDMDTHQLAEAVFRFSLQFHLIEAGTLLP